MTLFVENNPKPFNNLQAEIRPRLSVDLNTKPLNAVVLQALVETSVEKQS